MQRLESKHLNNTAKLSEIDKHIDLEERKLTEIVDSEQRKIILRRLCNLKDEISVQLEAALLQIKHSDHKLKELKTAFINLHMEMKH